MNVITGTSRSSITTDAKVGHWRVLRVVHRRALCRCRCSVVREVSCRCPGCRRKHKLWVLATISAEEYQPRCAAAQLETGEGAII